MYAIIVTGGKQYKAQVGQVLEVEKLDGEVGATVSFPVLMTSDGENVVTAPALECKATIMSHGKSQKIVVYKYKPKKNIRKKQGHRQHFTQIKIASIG